MDELEARLHQLVITTCQEKPGSLKRSRGLTQLIRLVLRSGKLWKEYAPYYEDALQQTWLYFCRNLCEATTGEAYDPNRSSISTWLNAYLKRRLQDYRIQTEQARRTQASSHGDADDLLDPLDLLEAPADIPPILEATQRWAEYDATDELRRTHIQGHPRVNCQVLILRRLPPETSWKDLSIEFNLPIPTLSSFYQRQCLPRLRKFGELQGYL
ncbi:sigma-70 family RNA polymerase sigma factor [Leptolyngbya sp. FACHB-261]|uniref:sigma-70 family RNA polymerase sigma factor n=1 Tax=Leptolyngbya sp. FACHB-261 TaxID=2692806 RepID=UPI001687B459|nr:sigma-70 family RNA polymerase sigma factor [Leptolyngbya sp. FACHB-261]MBD2103155.1 sigma-70 family RNA polymerase sigma factor [Leptolyngbya sp. FACHB-261]